MNQQQETAAWTGAFEALLLRGRLNVLDVGCGTGEIRFVLRRSERFTEANDAVLL